MTKKEVRGSIRWFRKESLVFLKWRDTKDVCALYTCYAASGEDRTQRKTKWPISNIEYSNAENILYTEGMTHKDFRQCLANELLERSELQLNPNPSPGRPLRSSVHEEHCPVPLTRDHLTRKSSKATFGRTNCKLCSILFKKEQKTPWRCRTYDIPLCLQLDRNCFEKWHTAEGDKFQN